MTDNGYSLADIAAATGNGNNGGWGNNGWEWIIVLFLFAGWGNGFGGGFGGNGGGRLTRGELCQDMNFQSVENAVRGIQQGLCDGFYAMNTGMLNGFAGVDNAICTLGYNNAQLANQLGTTVMQGFNAANITALQGQNAIRTQLADCCCQTQRAIDGVNYNMAQNTCNILNTMNTNTRDIIDSQTSGTRAILDYLCQEKISSLQAENQSLKLAASQANQNVALGAMMEANTAEILRRTAPIPVPAYSVPAPYPYGYNSGCGCGCGTASF